MVFDVFDEELMGTFGFQCSRFKILGFCIFSFKKQISTENPNQKSKIHLRKACENNNEEFWSKNMMLGLQKTSIPPAPSGRQVV